MIAVLTYLINCDCVLTSHLSNKLNDLITIKGWKKIMQWQDTNRKW